jgi:hypothetical protein
MGARQAGLSVDITPSADNATELRLAMQTAADMPEANLCFTNVGSLSSIDLVRLARV